MNFIYLPGSKLSINLENIVAIDWFNDSATVWGVSNDARIENQQDLGILRKALNVPEPIAL